MLTPDDIVQTFESSQRAHAAVVHAPIAIGAVSAIVVFVSACLGGTNRTLRWGAMAACVITAASAWLATRTGESARDEVGDAPAAARVVLEEHEDLAETGALIAYAAAVFAGLAFWPQRGASVSAAWTACALSSAAAYWFASAGHQGGRLVYEFGTGTPKPLTERDLAPGPDSRFADDPRLETYVSDVAPVLARYCYSCHGSVPRPAGGLSLTTAAGILRGGDSGPALIPGDPEGSLLFQAISGAHPELTMPPGPRRPGTSDIEAIRRWIESGAVWTAPEE